MTSLDAIGAAAATSLAVAALATRLTARHPRPRVPVVAATRRRLLPLQLGRVVPPPGPDDVADWCELVARSLRSGSSLTAAVTAGATAESSMATVVEPVVRHVTRGEPLVVALDGSGVDLASPAGLAFTVLRSCARFGGPAAIPLERAAATLRVRAAVAAEQQAQSAQAQLSARVLTLVPIALLGMLAVTDAKVRAVITTPAGLAVVVLGGLLNVAGALWMRRIIGRPK
jgi:tight adherence protein B